VQVSFVGFPGTMGAGFIDYVIADPFVLPMDQQAVHSKKTRKFEKIYAFYLNADIANRNTIRCAGSSQ
jgi:predicted O-linked N-acetylglucosamine transferase (SPINDLY family)